MPTSPFLRKVTVTLGLVVTALLLLCLTASTQSVTSGVTLSSPSFAVNNTGGHIQTNVANNDTAGTITITAAMSNFHPFLSPYVVAPVCVATPTSDPSAAATWWVTSNMTAVTVHLHSTTSLTFTYVCIGNPN